jgi:hypothetical protein
MQDRQLTSVPSRREQMIISPSYYNKMDRNLGYDLMIQNVNLTAKEIRVNTGVCL